MSIRFAAAGSGECLSVARTLRRPRLSAPANDSDAAWPQDVLLQSALRHFAHRRSAPFTPDGTRIISIGWPSATIWTAAWQPA